MVVALAGAVLLVVPLVWRRGARRRLDRLRRVGLPAGKMSEKQKTILLRLLQGYAERMPPEVGASEMARVKAAGLDTVHFAIAREEDKPGRPYTYRVQGPTFVIEFLNIQPDSAGNPANHIHSAWRDLPGDFGLAQR